MACVMSRMVCRTISAFRCSAKQSCDERHYAKQACKKEKKRRVYAIAKTAFVQSMFCRKRLACGQIMRCPIRGPQKKGYQDARANNARGQEQQEQMKARGAGAKLKRRGQLQARRRPQEQSLSARFF
eukprot:1161126-Pelagomonas_calceolata.AAC.1